jgi:hypothetical protein
MGANTEDFHAGHSDPLNSIAKIRWHAVVGGKRYPLEKTLITCSLTDAVSTRVARLERV